MPEKPLILVTGATGYIGGRLVPLLLERGFRVRCMTRHPQRLAGRRWSDQVQIVAGDVLDPRGLTDAMRGCDIAFYLVHAMGGGESGFADRDREGARHFAEAAASANVKRIIYLGGLGHDQTDLSEHLSSRHEVGEILARGTVPCTELRAAMIIGSGSASFEMLRYLTERLPVMICPRWVQTRCQPIAIRQVLAYLIGCLDEPRTTGRRFDIGGPDVLTYREMMQTYARLAGLPPRRILTVPLLTPRLSSHWVNLVTPIPRSIARPLIEGLRNEVVCLEQSIRELIPLKLMGFEESVKLALEKVRLSNVETRWSGTLARAAAADEGDPQWAGGTRYADRQVVLSPLTPQQCWARVAQIGGDTGWYYADWAWEIRGAIDRLIGGVGLRRGRRHPTELYPGESLDFWRVEVVDPPNRLLLRAEMKLPGVARLEFIVEPAPEGSRLTQVARFAPRGLFGIIYWWGLWPMHWFIFREMARSVAGLRGNGEHSIASPRGA